MLRILARTNGPEFGGGTMSEKQIFDLMVLGSGWQPDDGEVGGVFNRHPEGYRCLWSSRWMTQIGLLEPGKWMPLDQMTQSQLVYESLDVVYRMAGDYIAGKLMPLLLAYQSGTKDTAWIANMRHYLAQLRGSDPEYCCPWWEMDPKKVIWRHEHPGFKNWTGVPEPHPIEEKLTDW
jgi:hypothetical protein